jgi:hypothetical protein
VTSVLTDRQATARRETARRRAAEPARTGRLASEQLAVAGGQLGAGLGNLLFATIAARILEPRAFAELAAFLALYLTIHVPAASLSAGSALSPALAARARWRVLGASAGAGAILAALAFPLAGLLHLSPALLLAAAASAPTAGLIALDRGRLYGLGRLPRAVGSLLAEPLVRLTLGIALALIAGPVGAAIAVVVAGWVALAVAHLPKHNTRGALGSNSDLKAPHVSRPADLASLNARRSGRLDAGRSGAPTAGVIAAFLLLAVVQNQDVLLANGVLPSAEAARFAVLSTFGGAAAFATTTVPLMLLGRAGDRRALRVALILAGALGLSAVAVVAVAPGALVATVFGDRYGTVGAYAVPYLLAMALLGVARVLVAHTCATRERGPVIAALVGAAALQALLLLVADDVAGVVTATLAATTALTAAAGALALRPVPPSVDRRRAPADGQVALRPAPAPRGGQVALRDATTPALPARLGLPRPTFAGALALVRRRDVAVVAALTVTGFGLRLLSSRGIWLDEATSIWQAQMPLSQLLETLRTTDVHPPLHHLVLWATVRVLGTGELAVRMPSLLAATALIPLLYAAGRDIYDRRAGLAAAALVTVAPFTVWYAQEARMYALFMLFALISVWMQVRILRGGNWRDWAGFTLAAAALVATQYFGLVLVAVQQLAFVVALGSREPRGMTKAWLLSGVALALLLAPVLDFGHAQFAANEAAGKGFQQVPSQTGGAVGDAGTPPGPYAALTNLVWAVFGYHSNGTMRSLVALWPLLLLLALALLGRGRSRHTLLLVAAAAVPAGVLFGLGQLKPFVFEARYFIGSVPLVLLLLGRALTSWTPRRTTQVAAGAVAVALLGAGLADQQLNGDNPRVYDFRGALTDIADHAGPRDVVVYSPPYLSHVVAYYAKGVDARPLGGDVPRPARGGRVIVLGSFLDKPQFRDATAAAVRKLVRKHDLVAKRRYPQIRVWEFER